MVSVSDPTYSTLAIIGLAITGIVLVSAVFIIAIIAVCYAKGRKNHQKFTLTEPVYSTENVSAYNYVLPQERETKEVSMVLGDEKVYLEMSDISAKDNSSYGGAVDVSPSDDPVYIQAM